MKNVHITFENKEAEKRLLADKEFMAAMTKMIELADGESKSATSACYSANQKYEQCFDCAYNWNNFDDKGNVKIGWCYMFDNFIPKCEKKILEL